MFANASSSLQSRSCLNCSKMFIFCLPSLKHESVKPQRGY